MKTSIINTTALIATVLALTVCAPAQRRRAGAPPRPAPVTEAVKITESPAGAPSEPAVKRAVSVAMKDGTNVAGEYAGANQTAIFLMVAGNRLILKLDDVSAIYFGEPPAAARATQLEKQPTTLTIEAGIIYKMGGNQPVARADFKLLDQSLEIILRQAGLPEGRTGVLTEYSFAIKYPSQYPGVAERAQQAIREHTVSSVSTDFSGKAKFTDLKPGNYFISGFTSTRRGFAIWNVPVEVKAGENSIFLDQNNAATAF